MGALAKRTAKRRGGYLKEEIAVLAVISRKRREGGLTERLHLFGRMVGIKYIGEISHEFYVVVKSIIGWYNIF